MGIVGAIINKFTQLLANIWIKCEYNKQIAVILKQLFYNIKSVLVKHGNNFMGSSEYFGLLGYLEYNFEDKGDKIFR